MSNQAPRTFSLRNLIAANVPSTTKAVRTASWVTLKGGSDWVGASAFRAGTGPDVCRNGMRLKKSFDGLQLQASSVRVGAPL
jgi:hypothetical protein